MALLFAVNTVSIHAQEFGDSTEIAGFKSFVYRNRDTLSIHLKNGQTKNLVSDKSEESEPGERYYSEIFLFEDYLVSKGFFLVRQSWQDGDYVYLLIRDKDGYTFSVLDVPIISPSGKYFAIASFGLDSPFDANAIDICTFIRDSISLEYSIQPKDWGPKEVRWISEDTVFVLKATPIDSTFEEYADSQALLVRQNNVWTLKDY